VKIWYMYLCDRAGQLYTGITTNLDHRMKQHHAQLLYTEAFEDKHVAARKEREIKGWRREKKMELIHNSKCETTPLEMEDRLNKAARPETLPSMKRSMAFLVKIFILLSCQAG